MSQHRTGRTHISISVDIPALSELVCYLREKDRQEARIALITSRVQAEAQRVRGSNTVLKNAVEQVQTELEKE